MSLQCEKYYKIMTFYTLDTSIPSSYNAPVEKVAV